ncbi:MAG: transposase [Dermatophilaceae bacterium]
MRDTASRDMTGTDMSAPTSAALEGFRTGFYGCLSGWGDALFELTDATLCTPAPVSSVPTLSLEPTFRRSHGSLYKGLARGEIDDTGLRVLLMAHLPPDWPLVFAVDASSWPRCDAETSPERGFYYSASRHSAGKPIVAGWSYQWISQLDWAPDSWTAPLDAQRIPPSANPTTATIDQVRRLLARLPADLEVPMFVFDAGYDPIALGYDLAEQRVQVLVRISPKRVFHPDPPPRLAGARGRPPRHGPRFALSDPAASRPAPDAEHRIHDKAYGNVHVQAWRGLHPKLHSKGRWAGHDAPPIAGGTVIRVQVQHLPKPNGQALKTLWLWWSGPGEPDLDVCWRAYLRRFDIEHTYRFAKNTLGWTTPALRTPEQG